MMTLVERQRSLEQQKVVLEEKLRTARTVGLFSFTPHEFAQQLTAIEINVFNRIHRSELENQRWARDDGDELAPNVVMLLRLSEYIACWVQSEVMIPVDERQRAVVISHFVSIAKHCHQMNNFNALNSILNGLQSDAVRRLENSWKHIPQHSHSAYEELCRLMVPESNYRDYRKALMEARPPALPYLKLVLQDLMQIQLSPRTAAEASAKHVNDFLTFHQQLAKQFGGDQDLITQHFLLTRDPESQPVLNARSLQREPQLFAVPTSGMFAESLGNTPASPTDADESSGGPPELSIDIPFRSSNEPMFSPKPTLLDLVDTEPASAGGVHASASPRYV